MLRGGEVCFVFLTQGLEFCTEKLPQGQGFWQEKLVALGSALGGGGGW